MKLQDLPIEGFERIVRCELVPGVVSIIAIHNSKLGPALGGVRYYPYEREGDALYDVRRLAEGMSYKAAMANLPLGGGKAVIMGDPKSSRKTEILSAFGKFVDALGGKYITAKDVGVTVEDLEIISRETKHLTGINKPGSSGDPSPMTSYGVYQGLRAAHQFVFGTPAIKGKKVFIQGLGKVGEGMARYLAKEGARVSAAEIDERRALGIAGELGIEIVSPWDTGPMDTFSPNAMGAVLTPETIAKLHSQGCRIICGGANNQLADVGRDGALLHSKGILYAPDYVVNAGGIINITCEIGQAYDEAKARRMTDGIFATVTEIFTRSRRENRPTSEMALEMALERLK